MSAEITFTVSGFINYFKANDKLIINQGRHLVILNISTLVSQNFFEKDQRIPHISTQKALFLLNKMGQPLGKIFSLSKDIFSASLNKNLDLYFWNNATIKSSSGDIDTRLSDLFRLMLVSSTPQVNIASGHSLNILGITDEEINQEISSRRMLEDFFNRRMLLGQICTISCNGSGLYLEKRKADPENLKFENSLVIRGENVGLSCYDNFIFLKPSCFRERLLLSGELEIPIELTIFDKSIIYLFQEHNAYFSHIPFANFFLNYLALPLGKTVSVSHEITHFFEEPNCIKIRCETPFKLSLTSGPLVTNLYDFGLELIKANTMKISLEPNQEITIYGLTNDEICIENTLERIRRILIKRNPMSFTWHLEIDPSFECAFLPYGTQKKFVMVVSSQGEIEFSLKQATPRQFIFNLLRSSHPQLLRGILKSDFKANYLITFRALFYCICDQFLTHSLDGNFFLFKKSIFELVRVYQRDKQFCHALQSIVEGLDKKIIEEIFASDFSELLKQNLKKCPGSSELKFLLSLVEKLTNKEFEEESLFLKNLLELTTEYVEKLATRDPSNLTQKKSR